MPPRHDTAPIPFERPGTQRLHLPEPDLRRRPQIPGAGRITVTRVAAARTREIAGNTVRRINAASRADGAGETGLTGLLWTSALNTAGDALIAVSLAGTLFFAAAVDAQRSNVALYLLITVAPFAVVAPLLGPAMDRLQRGRRATLAASLIGRALLAWIMAANYDNFALYPAALGAMILSKGFGVLRATVVPRVLPPQLSQVAANARLSIFGLVSGTVLGLVGVAVAKLLGFSWELGFTAVVFLIGAVLAMRLPAHVESNEGEVRARVLTSGQDDTGRLDRRALGLHVITALRATSALRGLAGFLTIFMAFLIQATVGTDWAGNLTLGAVAGAAGLGSFIGTAIGSRIRNTDKPDFLVLISTGVAATVAVLTAFTYNIFMAVLMALIAGITNALGKTALDAIIQREVPESLRASAFGRSETLLQLAWVFGGAVGILLPTIGWIGFTVAAALLVIAFGFTLYGRNRPRPIRFKDPRKSADDPHSFPPGQPEPPTAPLAQPLDPTASRLDPYA
ncbi:MAG: MFS transporter [Geodermatophilaceae bacterium]|nr:MFS transporter [Geodermatophilaceae bacterium]